MDISDSLKSTENSLRDLFNFVLSKQIGVEWCRSCGVTMDRISQWDERRLLDEKKLGHCDPRLIYYADFYDLKTILKKNWANGLSEVFGKLKEIEVLLDLLNEIRNPEAHRRELLPYQKHLAIGISGKIKSDITGYFSKMETGNSFYPRFECIQDNLGNTWSIGEHKMISTGSILRPGDYLQFKVSATDPLGDDLEYTFSPKDREGEVVWSNIGDFDLTIKNNHVGKNMWVEFLVRSPRDFHATWDICHGKIDDTVTFCYEVLPPR
ncbi:hypothetical protein [uncultured Desulfobulbus sp.]|uniref:hypothetical protein n=1 Tax=uncultured Desulfobulbus sp. TaxID=239745 RepID=UPI0029C75032|nr:hypothetical protein [uncultured Desulfobulbus sp.]